MIGGAAARAGLVAGGVAAGVLAALLLAPATAAADPAGPTDYASEIVAISPPSDAIELSIAGGDSFVVIGVVPGTDVVVLGYHGEPYLRIDAEGTVWENLRSPARYANAERYGVDRIPTAADPEAPPEWRRVGRGGTWAWHDHRAHRMEPYPPVNVDRGDVVLDAVVPLLVDGVEVDVRVSSRWMPAPSRLPAALGLVAGLLLVGVLRARPALALGAVAAAALVVGTIQFRSLPAATDPRWLWWLAPLVALAGSAAAAVLGARTFTAPVSTRQLLAYGATGVAAAQLLVWGLERHTGLTRAILPTDAPFWLDRVVTAAALSGGAAGAVVVLVTIGAAAGLGLSRQRPRRAPGRARGRGRRRPSVPSAPPRSCRRGR